MSKKAIIVFLFCVFALVCLSGCSPTCAPGSLEAPDLISPNWREVVDGSAAVLDWSYPDASCNPEQYEIILSEKRDYSVIEHSALVDGGTTIWTAPTLDIAEEYFWRVRAKVGSTYGPYSHELRSFFTEPICSAGDLVAPNLVYPDFGGIYDNDYESLEWAWPSSTCIPESYRVEVSMGSPSFADTTYNGATGSPGTRWGFGSTPPIATQFWWRVSAYADGAYGPTSMAKMFWTAPSCPASSLVAPIQESPLDDGIVTTLDPIFVWSYPDPSCTPEGHRILVSETPDMSTIVFDANSPTSAARAMISWETLTDCKEYYWQISAISESVEGPPSPVHRFVIDTGGGCDCASDSTTIPVQTNPSSYEILPDTNANLRWLNPGGCFPDGAAVQIATDYDFTDMAEFTFPGQFVTGYDPPGLDPATQYRWKAAYYVEDSGPVIGDYSGPRSFFTGPECTSLAEVVAPVRLAPADGSVVNTLAPALKYTTGIPGCIPDGYLLHLHMLPDFSDPNLLTEYSMPATTVITEPLTNCQDYYWSVTAVQDGGYGPESDQGYFTVNVDGTCLPPGVPGMAKNNNFCREGTFAEHFKALWTFEAGDRVLAIARNPLFTYLKLSILDQETLTEFKPAIYCWSYIGNFEPGWPETPAGRTYDFGNLREENPPPPPTPTPTPVPVLRCNEKLSLEDCRAAGGTYTDKKYCACP